MHSIYSLLVLPTSSVLPASTRAIRRISSALRPIPSRIVARRWHSSCAAGPLSGAGVSPTSRWKLSRYMFLNAFFGNPMPYRVVGPRRKVDGVWNGPVASTIPGPDSGPSPAGHQDHTGRRRSGKRPGRLDRITGHATARRRPRKHFSPGLQRPDRPQLFQRGFRPGTGPGRRRSGLIGATSIEDKGSYPWG